MPPRSSRVSVANAKKSLSELLGRVAYGNETITITKRGRPMARLVPPTQSDHPSLAEVKGWLDADDPFFDIMDEIVAERHSHRPRRIPKLKGRRLSS